MPTQTSSHQNWIQSTKGHAGPQSYAVASDQGSLNQVGPLTEQQKAHFQGGKQDSLPPTSIHYIKTNETRHDVWIPYLSNKGGAYAGVGADQNYTLMAAAGSQLGFLLDIDSRVSDLHRIYEILIEASPTPERLVDRFSRKEHKNSLALLEQALTSEPENVRKRLLRGYKAGRETLHQHLLHVAKRRKNDQPTTWLSNPSYYQHIRTLYQNDRIRSMLGDLTGPQTMGSIALALKALNMNLNVLYMSNAEEYFKYTSQFRQNISGFPVEQQSVVLRTIYSKKWEHADSLWNYQVQSLPDFQKRILPKPIRSRTPMIRSAKGDGVLKKTTKVNGLSLIAVEQLDLAPKASGK